NGDDRMRCCNYMTMALFCIGLFLGTSSVPVSGGQEKATTVSNVDDKGTEKSDGGKVKIAKGVLLKVKLQGNPTQASHGPSRKTTKRCSPRKENTPTSRQRLTSSAAAACSCFSSKLNSRARANWNLATSDRSKKTRRRRKRSKLRSKW